MNFVAPSPSRTMACASPRDTSSTAPRRSARSQRPAAPVAMRMKESFVEVSPSTLMRLKEASAASATSRSSASCASAASVATNPSIVAMSGRIIPAPFAIPVTVAAPARRALAFGTVSVVMIASAARPQLSSRRSATHAGSPATILASGSGSMITPVENGSTSRGSQPSCRAAASQLALASASPVFPVPAFALPVFTTSARVGRPKARCSLATWTGAAQKRLRVNTPATLAPCASVTSSRSLRPDLRIPASATPSLTPFTGSRSSGPGGLRLTAIFLLRPPASGELAVAVLVFFPRAAGAGVVAPDLARVPHKGRGLGGGRDLAFGAGERFLVAGVLVLHVLDRGRLELLDRLLVAHLQLHRHQRPGHLELHRLDQVAEQLEGLALVLLLGVLLRVAAQVYALAQVVERGEMLAPVVVERRQQHVAFDEVHAFGRVRFHLAAVRRVRLRGRALEQRLVVEAGIGGEPLGQRQLDAQLRLDHLLQPRYVPLLLDALLGDVRAEQVGDHALAQRLDLVRHVLRVEYGISELVDLAPLVVRDVVVFEQLLADVEVVRFDLALRALDRAGHEAVLDRLALGHPQALHDRVDALAGEDAQQRILERQEEARRARVA